MESHQIINKSIPQEVITFLDIGGNSLLIRGSAGSGKSSLIYKLIEHYKDEEIILWTNHNISEQKINKYPFLKNCFIIERDTIERSVALQKLFEHLQNTSKEKKVMIFLDNVERLVSRYVLARGHSVDIETETESLVQNIENEFISKYNANLIMTSEQVGEGPLVHIARGCIILNRIRIDGKIMREMEICKLEDSGTAQKNYIFTLTNGEFACIKPQGHHRVYFSPVKIEPIPSKEGYYSSGVESLDILLGGGYRPGSVNLFEVAVEVPEWVYLSILYPSIYNFISLNCGVVLSLAGSQTPIAIHKNIVPLMGDDKFSSLVRILTPFTQATRQQYVLSAHSESTKERLNIWKNAITQLKTITKNNPVLDITGFTGLEYTFEKSALLQMIDDGFKRINYEGDVGIGIVRSESDIVKNLANISDTYFRIKEMHGVYIISGIKPRTDFYIMNFSDKFPQYDLVLLS